MSATWRLAVAGLDLATTVCAALNLTYFLNRLLSPDGETASRRVAALVLAVVSLGVLLESVFLLASASAAGSPPVLESLPWTLVRLVPFAGAASISALVLRRIVGARSA